ncbi:ABC transporter ATP-binding protein/permease [Streptomyces sp. NBC_00669]|uniref:ABC transporter ATP-binding protein n=1 Tax=Streptomyces sp. NBC_00669 TaxID=2976011 RepID=UPI002E37E414|nr:ABC transporter ATP-binding protein [Streptomyces sp. NBC_00669]
MADPDATPPPRVVRPATRGSRAAVCAVAVLAGLSVGLGLLLPTALGHAVDQVLRGRGGGRWVWGCAAVVAGQVLVGAASDVLAAVSGARVTAAVRRRAVRHVLAARVTGGGDLVTRLVSNAADAGGVPAAVATLPAAIGTPLGGIVALFLTDPWLAAAFLLGAPPMALLVHRFARASSDSVARYQDAQGRIAARLVEAIGGARTIAAARTEEREAARVLRPLPELSAQGHRMWRVQGRATAQAAVLVPLLQILVLAVGGLRLAQGALTVGGLLAASRYALLATGIGAVVGQLGALVRGRAAARRIAGVLAVPAPAHGTARLPQDGSGTLEVRGVTVTRGGETVLDRLDLTVPGGSCVAVVGPSGAGKSVLAALAGRLTDPDEGIVLLDGRPLSTLSRLELRDAVGYAFERPVLLGDTLADAIAFGPRELTTETVTGAARAAGADGFLRRLPDGYATPRAAAPLSGGEVQRLGLARAFAHGGRLLVLDDATSSLDTVTELHVAHSLLHDPLGRTRLLTTHRAATAARADLVAWLDSGRLRALAPHRTLWQDPAYRALFAVPSNDPGGPVAAVAVGGEGEL